MGHRESVPMCITCVNVLSHIPLLLKWKTENILMPYKTFLQGAAVSLWRRCHKPRWKYTTFHSKWPHAIWLIWKDNPHQYCLLSQSDTLNYCFLTLRQLLQRAGWPRRQRRIFSCMNHTNGVWDFSQMAAQPLIGGIKLGWAYTSSRTFN